MCHLKCSCGPVCVSYCMWRWGLGCQLVVRGSRRRGFICPCWGGSCVALSLKAQGSLWWGLILPPGGQLHRLPLVALSKASSLSPAAPRWLHGVALWYCWVAAASVL